MVIRWSLKYLMSWLIIFSTNWVLIIWGRLYFEHGCQYDLYITSLNIGLTILPPVQGWRHTLLKALYTTYQNPFMIILFMKLLKRGNYALRYTFASLLIKWFIMFEFLKKWLVNQEEDIRDNCNWFTHIENATWLQIRLSRSEI